MFSSIKDYVLGGTLESIYQVSEEEYVRTYRKIGENAFQAITTAEVPVLGKVLSSMHFFYADLDDGEEDMVLRHDPSKRGTIVSSITTNKIVGEVDIDLIHDKVVQENFTHY